MNKKDNSILDSIGDSGLTAKEKADRQRKRDKQDKKNSLSGMIPYLREAQYVFRMIDNLISV